MQDVIKKLTAEQALEVVKRLSGKGGKIQEAVLVEARDVLSEIDLHETADEDFFILDSIDVEDCWDRAGDRYRCGLRRDTEVGFRRLPGHCLASGKWGPTS